MIKFRYQQYRCKKRYEIGIDCYKTVQKYGNYQIAQKLLLNKIEEDCLSEQDLNNMLHYYKDRAEIYDTDIALWIGVATPAFIAISGMFLYLDDMASNSYPPMLVLVLYALVLVVISYLVVSSITDAKMKISYYTYYSNLLDRLLSEDIMDME